MSIQTTSPACPAELSKADIELFWEQGYLAFENLLTDDEVEESKQAISDLVQGMYADLAAGRAKALSPNPGVPQNYGGMRLHKNDSSFWMQFEASVEDPASLSPEEAELRYRKLAGYVKEHTVFVNLISHPRVKGFVEQILKTEATMFGDMALSKPPHIGAEKPWHQDDAYFDYLPLESIVSAWIALDDATEENGCMYTIRGAHRKGARKHVHGIDCQIEEGRLDLSRAIPVELKAGGAMFFSGMLPHQTPPNRSPHRRRALQFQYRGSDTVKVDKEDYEKAFREPDGTAATCWNAALEAKKDY